MVPEINRLSVKIAWLIDVIALDEKTTTSVLANFKQVVGDAALCVYPFVMHLLDFETEKRLIKVEPSGVDVTPVSEVEK